MIKFGCSLTTGRLSTTLMILGMALLMAACSSGDGNNMAAVEMPTDGDGMAGDNGEPMMTALGEWNTLTTGALDISDTNEVLRAHYDGSGIGRVVAAAPVQPAGTGTATWNGRWSGKIEVNPDPLATVGLGFFGLTPEGLAEMGGVAQATAYFDNGDVEVALIYKDVGLDVFEFSEITPDRVPVTDGRFEIRTVQTASFTTEVEGFGETSGHVSGDLMGEGAFGGAEAAGVVGYIGGDLDIEYGRGPTSLGTFQSVFYGARDEN